MSFLRQDMDRIISNTSAKNLEAILKINAFTYFISSEKGLAYFRFQNKILQFRTRIFGVEGKHGDH